ncbi:MAG: hypothetical protein ABIQ13_13585 [Pedococcus sp.]
MSVGSVVTQEIDERTAHAVVAAQVRGENKVDAEDADAVVHSIATELEQIGLDPDVGELERRYHGGDTRVPESLRQRTS